MSVPPLAAIVGSVLFAALAPSDYPALEAAKNVGLAALEEGSLSEAGKRFEAIQDRKHVQRYLKAAPPLTLGQLLNPSSDE